MDDEKKHRLSVIAQGLVAAGRGILAADESTKTITKRFESINVPSTVESRRQYRQLLFTTPGVEKFISGVIVYDETIHQQANNGESFVSILQNKGIIPGIKVDLGTVPMAESPMEVVTEGLEGLPERLNNYFQIGARFTKWRAVISIGKDIPTVKCLQINADRLAEFASLSQVAGMVPIVEPEVLMDGNHTIDRCEEVTRDVLNTVFSSLEARQVYLPGILLKPNMIVPGNQSGQSINVVLTSQITRQVLEKTVPTSVPGIVFLSGGMTPQQATENLNEMNKNQNPWALSFSFGRALQEPVLETWLGQESNIQLAQEAFLKRARLNSLARGGEYQKHMEHEA